MSEGRAVSLPIVSTTSSTINPLPTKRHHVTSQLHLGCLFRSTLASVLCIRTYVRPYTLVMSGTVKCKGATQFRLRVACCMLSCRRLVISQIREDDRQPGITDYEASFLRLVEKMVNGARFAVNDTGTQVSISPGLITGGEVRHDCGKTRGVGYFIEGILPLLPFCKQPLMAEFTGVTSEDLDLGADRLKYSTLELLRYFGYEEGMVDVQIMGRGALPDGGGKVRVRVPPVRALKPLQLTTFGMVKKVRGYAYATKVSPQFCNRMITAARALLNEFIPDVRAGVLARWWRMGNVALVGMGWRAVGCAFSLCVW